MDVYCINSARYLFRGEPIEVMAASANNGEIRFRQSAEMTTAIQFPEERLAVFTSSFAAAKTSEYSLVGTRGRLRISPAYDYSVPLAYELVTDEGKSKPQRKKFPKHDHVGAELGVEGLPDVRIVQAILESAD